MSEVPMRELSGAEMHAFTVLIRHALYTGVHRDDLDEFVREATDIVAGEVSSDNVTGD